MRLWWLIPAFIGIVFLLIMMRDEQDAGVSSDQLFYILYLAPVGLLVAAGLLGSGLRLGKLMHYALIWVVIILGLLFAYHQRYQLQDIGHQLTMGLFPASPLSMRDENGLNVILRRAANGHFETYASVNGRENIYFTLDTGASSVVLRYEDAHRIGIDVENLSFSVTTYTANGRSLSAPVRLQSLKVGEIERINIKGMVARPGALSDNLLGMNFLNSLSGYTVRADQMTLLD